MGYQNFFATRLFTDIGASDTTITLETAPTETAGRMVLEARNSTQREIIKYTGVSGNDLTGVLRGQGGTTAKPHTQNSLVEMNLTAEDLEDVIGVDGKLTQYFDEILTDGLLPGGCVWSALTGLNAEMSAGIVYINGERIEADAVATHAFDASSDTYVFIDTNGAPVYEVEATGADIPASPADTVFVAKVVTDGSAVTGVETDDTQEVAFNSTQTRGVKGNVIHLTATGSYKKPVGLKFVVVTLRGAGGGGGGVGTTSGQGCGAGGGQGELAIKKIAAASLGATASVVIGAGGAGGAATGSTGSAGADTTFDTTVVVAKGGAGGAGSNGVTKFRPGGAGGTGGTGDLLITGASGISGGGDASSIAGGVGGGEGGGNARSGDNAGIAGVRGGGGGGALDTGTTGRLGGAGGDGWVTVEEYF